jgi:hypothetical protein
MTASTYDTLLAAESAFEAAQARFAALSAEESRWITSYGDLPRELAVNLGDAEVELGVTREAFAVAEEASWQDYHEYAMMKWQDRQDGAREHQEELAQRC